MQAPFLLPVELCGSLQAFFALCRLGAVRGGVARIGWGCGTMKFASILKSLRKKSVEEMAATDGEIVYSKWCDCAPFGNIR